MRISTSYAQNLPDHWSLALPQLALWRASGAGGANQEGRAGSEAHVPHCPALRGEAGLDPPPPVWPCYE